MNREQQLRLTYAYNGSCGVIDDLKKAGLLGLARQADVLRRDIADRKTPGEHHPLSGDLEHSAPTEKTAWS